MRIIDICTRHVIHIAPDAPIAAAAESMRRHHVGALVVVDQPNGERVPVGMITDRDIVVAVLASGVDPDAVSVRDVMSSPVTCCGESQELFDAIRLMRERGVRRLPVLNLHGGLAGMVAADDVYGALASHLRELSYALTREQVQEMQTRA